MRSLSDREAEVIGLYGIVRRILVEEVVSTTPIDIEGVRTTKYADIPVKRPHSYASALEAAQRLQMEGFSVALFYPDSDPNVLHLIAVWDPQVLRHPGKPMPCLFCSTKDPSWESCGGCAKLNLWCCDNILPGKIIKPTAYEKSLPYSPVEDVDPQVEIPTAGYMRSVLDEKQYSLSDDFSSPLLYRVSKKLNWWITCVQHESEFLPGVKTSCYVTVPLSPREVSEPEILRKTIFKLEGQGYTCGPVNSDKNRPVLFVCWDEAVSTIFPKPSPCTLDCDYARVDLESCYCTQYDAWVAEWKHTTGVINFVEQ